MNFSHILICSAIPKCKNSKNKVPAVKRVYTVHEKWPDLPIACGATKCVKPVANIISNTEYNTQHTYCNPTENESSSYNQIFAESKKKTMFVDTFRSNNKLTLYHTMTTFDALEEQPF